MPLALYALAAGAFGIGVTEFVIMGLLPQIATDFSVSLPAAGGLISGYALAVVAAPLLTVLGARWPRKILLLGLMLIFTLGNIACALAPDYHWLMAARVLTALAHGTFFGVGSVVATELVAPERKASAIAFMFGGLTLANILGVPFGTWLGQGYGWRATFWVVGAVGVFALAVIARALPPAAPVERSDWRHDIATMAQPAVLLRLLTTVLGFAGVFTVFTYIAPLLTSLAHLAESAVAPVLLLFGLGLVAGNVAGGKLADRRLLATVCGTLVALALVLAGLAFALRHALTAVLAVGLFGAAAFATVAPLQMWVLEKTAGSAQSLASSMNIAAFNLGNALGAALGGALLAHGAGLGALAPAAALLPLAALAVALATMRRERAAPPLIGINTDRGQA